MTTAAKVSLAALLIALPLAALAQDGAPQAFSNKPTLSIERQELKFSGSRPKSLFETPASIARGFVNEYAKSVKVDPESLQPLPAFETLRGTSFLFQQRINGLDVFGAQIRVLVDADKMIDDAVFSSLVPVEDGKTLNATPAIASREEIFDKVWKHLRASGNLTAEPRISTGYLPVGSDLTLAYEVLLPVSEPLGEWRCYVDANSGEIINPGPDRITDPGILCENTMPPAHKRAMLPDEDRETGDRLAAFNEFLRQARSRSMSESGKALGPADIEVDGMAKIIDPDPRTATKNEALSPSSDPAEYEAAYQERPLLQITKRDNAYVLEGPWVTIADFDPPAIAPAASSDGKYLYRVGESGFSDVMAYYHIDRSQRYLQSIGFSGPRSIQGRSIPVDANAKSSKDNSAYSPLRDALMFGKGCAPDAEDADVILHEYGHALTYSILKRMGSDWAGGDSKAVGEGFGDYWAATSRVSTTANGAAFLTDRVFPWDASCGWDGRTVNADPKDIRYDPNCTYGAHAVHAKCGLEKRAFTAGRQSDELWSTPTFQAFLSLTREHGRPRAEVDRIVLEAMHRLVSGFTMRQFAELIVYEAERLYPDGPHKNVFTAQFQRFGILEVADDPTDSSKRGNEE